MLYVKTNSPLETLGLAGLFEENEHEDGFWKFRGDWETAVGALIDATSSTFTYTEAACRIDPNVPSINAVKGWPAIEKMLKDQQTPEIEVGDTVVFTYDGNVDKRVVIVKEVDKRHIKGLDVLYDFAFKSFRRDKISNLKQVKA
jgi:hypothetical protein